MDSWNRKMHGWGIRITKSGSGLLFYFNVNPDPTFHFNANANPDLDPAPYQRCESATTGLQALHGFILTL